MSDTDSQKVATESRRIKKVKSKFPVDVEAEKKFEGLKRKYANAIAFLLVRNVSRNELQRYFSENEENARRFATIKKLRQEIIESRPKARVWVDKSFYVKLDLGEVVVGSDGTVTVPIVLGECVFKQPTRVVLNRKELDAYMETIAKIIEAEKVWADPDMADFDVGERDYLCSKQEEVKQAE